MITRSSPSHLSASCDSWHITLVTILSHNQIFYNKTTLSTFILSSSKTSVLTPPFTRPARALTGSRKPKQPPKRLRRAIMPKLASASGIAVQWFVSNSYNTYHYILNGYNNIHQLHALSRCSSWLSTLFQAILQMSGFLPAASNTAPNRASHPENNTHCVTRLPEHNRIFQPVCDCWCYSEP